MRPLSAYFVGVKATERSELRFKTVLIGQTDFDRDRYIDVLRAFSLVTVVLWHWVFTIVRWRPDGPHVTSPLQFTRDLWLLTWVFQVLPLFFFVGGFVHMRTWERAKATGVGFPRFFVAKLRRLAAPALALVTVWVALWYIVRLQWNPVWFSRAVLLVISPLWFIAVYVMLVFLTPIMVWLHHRFGAIVPVVLGVSVLLVDVFRFRYGWVDLAGLNLVLVWAFCHQLGFFYSTAVVGGPRLAAIQCWAGLLALVVLVRSGVYPGSMVGVPGDDISNISPPTMCIVALCLFQTGLALWLRPWVIRKMSHSHWRKSVDTVNRFSMPLFVFHTTGLALCWGLYRFVADYRPPLQPTVMWWLQRPLWLIGPLICTLPVMVFFGRRWITPKGPTDRFRRSKPLSELNTD